MPGGESPSLPIWFTLFSKRTNSLAKVFRGKARAPQLDQLALDVGRKPVLCLQYRPDNSLVAALGKRRPGSKSDGERKCVRGEVGGPADYIPFGLASIVREGGDVTLIGYGATVRTCVAAAGQLAGQGVSAEVIDLRTLYPLDLETVTASLRKTGRAVMVDESPGFGGVSAEIAASLTEAAFDYLDGPVMRVHAPHSPVPQSRVLLEALLPGGGQVAAAARALIARG